MAHFWFEDWEIKDRLPGDGLKDVAVPLYYYRGAPLWQYQHRLGINTSELEDVLTMGDPLAWLYTVVRMLATESAGTRTEMETLLVTPNWAAFRPLTPITCTPELFRLIRGNVYSHLYQGESEVYLEVPVIPLWTKPVKRVTFDEWIQGAEDTYDPIPDTDAVATIPVQLPVPSVRSKPAFMLPRPPAEQPQSKKLPSFLTKKLPR